MRLSLVSRVSASILMVAGVLGAEPAITARSATNAFLDVRVPAVVARGGILTITGEGLASETVKAEVEPLPITLGDPRVGVLVDGNPAPLFFVSPQEIRVQVPWETELGRVDVQVRMGRESSAKVPLMVERLYPSFVTDYNSGAPVAAAADGSVASASDGLTPGSVVRLFAAGIGAVAPGLRDGSPANPDTDYFLLPEQFAFVGGLAVETPTVTASTASVGIYDLELTVPEGAEATEVVRWVSSTGAITHADSVVLGPVGPPTARYMAVDERTVDQIPSLLTLSDLNPYFVAVSGELDPFDFCYLDVNLLDFRNDTSTLVEECLVPTFPSSTNEFRWMPFETPRESSVLAALPYADSDSGFTNQLMLIDTVTGETTKRDYEKGLDRLGLGARRALALRLQEAGEPAVNVEIALNGERLVEYAVDPTPPEELVVDGLSRFVAQPFDGPAGYRIRFLGPESATDPTAPLAVLLGPDWSVVAKLAFPDGWLPIVPPREINPVNGEETGPESVAPTERAFGNHEDAYVLVRSIDNSRDGVAIFSIHVSDEDSTGGRTAEMTARAVAFPESVFAANCTTRVRWVRETLSQRLLLAGAGQAYSDFSHARDGEICASDRILLYSTQTDQVEQEMVPDGVKLDAALAGGLDGYLYFGDGSREVPLKASTSLHVFDAATREFSQLDLPSANVDGLDVLLGVPHNNLRTAPVDGAVGQLLAMATVGDARRSSRGLPIPPIPGTEGLLLIDLRAGSATHLALPEGYDRIIQPRANFGMFPLIGRAYANVRRPGRPNGTSMITWDVATGEATAIPVGPPLRMLRSRPAGAGGTA